MSLIIKVEGGYADSHKISLNDISILSTSIQLISWNYEQQQNIKNTTDIYISAENVGSYELVLDILNHPITQGIGSAFLYDLTKNIKSYMSINDKKIFIQNLTNDIYQLAIELEGYEDYDIELERKKQLLEDKEQLLITENSTFNAIQGISKIVKESNDEASNRPTSISFLSKNLNNEDIQFKIGCNERKEIYEISQHDVDLDDIIITGILTHITREPKAFFKMKSPFLGLLKIYTTQEGINHASDYFKKNEQIKIRITPILKIGKSIKTREANLVDILEG